MTKQLNTAEDQAQGVVLEKKELKENQVELSDGRIIEMRESNGADEMVVAAELGDVFTPNGGGALIFQSCLIAKTIVSIDHEKAAHLRGYEEYRDFLAKYRSKDLAKVRKLYEKLNGEGENKNFTGAR